MFQYTSLTALFPSTIRAAALIHPVFRHVACIWPQTRAHFSKVRGARRHRDRVLYPEKRSRPVSRVLSWTAIHLGCASPHTSSNLPGNDAGRINVPLFGLAPGGVYPATPVTSRAVRSYRTISPLPASRTHTLTGGIFSVALSIDSRLPGVTWHPALWSPDFPPRKRGDCLADSGIDYKASPGQGQQPAGNRLPWAGNRTTAGN